MLLHSLKCRKKKLKIKLKSSKDNKRRSMFSLICAVCDHKKLRFIKKQEDSVLLSSLGIKTPLPQIPLVGPILFVYF